MSRTTEYYPQFIGNIMYCDVCMVILDDWFWKCLNCPFKLCKRCGSKYHHPFVHSSSHAIQCVTSQIEEGSYYQLYSCPWCPYGQIYFSVDNLYDHIIESHPAPRNPDMVYCPPCMTYPLYHFRKTSDITAHMRTTHGCFTKPLPR